MPSIDPVAKAIENSIAFDFRASWQVRAVTEAKGQTWMVLLSVLAHTYDHAVKYIIEMLYPHFDGRLPAPHLTSAAKVAKNGSVVADVVNVFGVIKETAIYSSETALRDDFRRLADRLKLNDVDRIELFKCVQRWVVADRRLDPSFDPQDPEAKRLVH